MSETEHSTEETKTELIPSAETGEGSSRTRELPPPPPTLVKAEPVAGPPLPMPPNTELPSTPTAPGPAMPPAPNPVDIPTGPMPMVERGEYTGSLPFVESGVPAEPVIPREPFIPPELMARRRPAPHSAAFALPQLQAPPLHAPPLHAPPLRPVQGAEPPTTGSVPLAGEPPPRPTPPAGPPKRRPLLLMIGVPIAVLAIVAAVGVGLRHAQHKVPPVVKHTATATPAAPVVLKAKISSFVLKDTGFRLQGKQYVTQTYKTPQFGGLKTGVGLLLDLGSAKSPTSISFDAGDGPLTVELRSGDQQSAALTDYTKTGSATSATGSTSLDASAGGSHRYWLIWVTQLGKVSRGYAAQIDNVTVKGTS